MVAAVHRKPPTAFRRGLASHPVGAACRSSDLQRHGDAGRPGRDRKGRCSRQLQRYNHRILRAVQADYWIRDSGASWCAVHEASN